MMSLIIIFITCVFNHVYAYRTDTIPKEKMLIRMKAKSFKKVQCIVLMCIYTTDAIISHVQMYSCYKVISCGFYLIINFSVMRLSFIRCPHLLHPPSLSNHCYQL